MLCERATAAVSILNDQIQRTMGCVKFTAKQAALPPRAMDWKRPGLFPFGAAMVESLLWPLASPFLRELPMNDLLFKLQF